MNIIMTAYKLCDWQCLTCPLPMSSTILLLFQYSVFFKARNITKINSNLAKNIE